MVRERFCRHCRGWHRDGEWPRDCAEALYGPRPERSDFPLPFIRRDHMSAPLWHPADGREYDSRSDYDAVTKARGLVEIGDADLSKEVRTEADTTIKADVIEAYQKVSQGYKPAPLDGNGEEGWSSL